MKKIILLSLLSIFFANLNAQTKPWKSGKFSVKMTDKNGGEIETFYVACVGDVKIEVTETKKNKPLTLATVEAENAELLKDGTLYHLIPKTNNFKLKIIYKKKEIASQSFSAKDVPTPSLKIFVDKKENPKASSMYAFSGVKFELYPEEKFAKTNSRDAKYEVVAYELKVTRDGKNVFEKSDIEISPDKAIFPQNHYAEIKAGDIVSIKISKAHRLDYNGKEISVIPKSEVNTFTTTIK